MIFDFRKIRTVKNNVLIDDKKVEIKSSYKYLGCWIDNKLKFQDQVTAQVKKSNKNLYFLRKMYNLKVDENILFLFYNTVIRPVLDYANIVCYNCLTQSLKNELNRPRHKCLKLIQSVMIKEKILDFDILCTNNIFKKTVKIMKDASHPFYLEYHFLPHGMRLNVKF